MLTNKNKVFFPIIGLSSLLLLSACGDDSGSKKTAESSPPTQSASAQPVSASDTSTPVQPTHNYVLEDNGEYGYEQKISQDDENAGRVAKPIVMIRYLGKMKNRYVAMYHEAGGNLYLSCEDPCDYFRVSYNSINNKEFSKIMHSYGTLGGAILEDARHGYLRSVSTSNSQE